MPGPVEGSTSGVGEGEGDCENTAAEPIVKDAARIAAVRVIDFKPGSICLSYRKNVELEFDPWIAEWHIVQFWYLSTAWLWNDGTSGAN